MVNVPISSSQKPSKLNDEAIPSSLSFLVDYSQNRATTDIFNQTTQSLRKKSTFLKVMQRPIMIPKESELQSKVTSDTLM
jgi:hypothetical protein